MVDSFFELPVTHEFVATGKLSRKDQSDQFIFRKRILSLFDLLFVFSFEKLLKKIDFQSAKMNFQQKKNNFACEKKSRLKSVMMKINRDKDKSRPNK